MLDSIVKMESAAGLAVQTDKQHKLNTTTVSATYCVLSAVSPQP